MEILNIKPIQVDSYNCFTNQLVSAVAYFRCDYELMFVESWGFSFSKDTNDSFNRLGKRITPDSGNYFEALEKYLGIKPIWETTKTTDDILNIIKTELAIKKPIIISFDPFWCPWSNIYQKVEYRQYNPVALFIVNGFDEKNSSLFCIDGHYLKDNEKLSIKSFLNGVNNNCLVFHIDENFKLDVDWHDIIKIAIDRVQKKQTFKAIRDFADIIVESLDFSVEFSKENDVLSRSIFSPLYKITGEISQKRRLFQIVLRYLAKEFNANVLLKFDGKFEQLASNWNVVLSLFIKGSYIPKSDALLNKIANKLREIADDEENTAYDLLQISQLDNSILLPGINNKSLTSKKGSLQYIDLNNYMNNRGFESSTITADFTGIGEYFLVENLPQEKKWVIGNSKFQFPNITESNYDNISCQGQKINIPVDQYSKIMVLGCAEWGSFSEKIILNYQNCIHEEILLGFTDWFADTKPVYNETLAWEGWSLSKGLRVKRHIYAQCYSIYHDKVLENFVLPDCPNIHIFAISLE